MQQWEYSFVAYREELQERPYLGDRVQEYVQVYVCTTQKGGTRVDSGQGTLLEGSVLTDVVAQLGIEGWEMSGHSEGQLWKRLWFKRPKQD